MNAVKKDDRFWVDDLHRGRLWGTIGADADDTQPGWPMVSVLFDGPGEKPYMDNVRKLNIVTQPQA